MIDFHSHLDLYPNGLALAHEVNRRNEFTLVVTTSPRAFYATSRVFNGLRNIHVGLGLHPEVAEAKSSELDVLVAGVKDARFIGEVGLDGSPRFRKSIELQERIFQAILIECGRQGGKIVSIHSRGAAQRTIEALAKAHDVGYPVLHWFSGGVSELRTAARLGCWFSVGPAMLAGEKGRSLLSHMPLDRVLPETDGPFATEGGVPLKPWDAWNVCTTLSDVWAMPRSAVEEQLRTNLKRLLGSQT
ncbi:Qat anti-phage system TatD family nuclease QatD [Burkholderia thailandensis]|uniref:Qat anti-phage system TatD family nuclease QatD n=1 Tax=Burkholderia thailandensis TaxID=57975 RepID=UPI0009E513F9|nr:Qat anti-phage system TatD family nuclease QatD [Burkholderia thailandensis]AVR24317.1 hydrolase TatD [Burkholderia thailandensis]